MKSTTGPSGLKGVCWDESRNKWRAQIRVGERMVTLGRYEKIIDAARAFDRGLKRFRDKKYFPFLNIKPRED